MSDPTTFKNNVRVKNGIVLEQSTPAIDATAGAITMTPAQILSGLLIRNTNGANRADLMPTVASLVLGLLNPRDLTGASFEFTIRNNAGAVETITVTTNTGWTLSGTMTIAQSNSKRFRVVFSSNAAATLYSLGTVVT